MTMVWTQDTVDPSQTVVNPSDGVMVALVPTNADWCKIACPHMTLVYAGLVSDLKPSAFNELGKETSDLAVLSKPISLKVSGTEEFGDGSPDNPLVEVLTLQSSPELRAMRRTLEGWNVRQWPFNPHVTVGPVGTVIDIMPAWIMFDRLMVGWGSDELMFSLRQGF